MKCDNSAGYTKCACAACAFLRERPGAVSVLNAIKIIAVSLVTEEPLSEQERVELWLAASYIDSKVGEKLSGS